MKSGDLVKFVSTGAVASIVQVSDDGRFVDLYVGDGSLDGTPSASGFTGMSMSMLMRTAEVISENQSLEVTK